MTKTLELDKLLYSLDTSLFHQWNVLKEAEETPAAKEAKEKGLHYIGFGRWANDEGKYVAKSENDRLVWIARSDVQPQKTKVKSSVDDTNDTPPPSPLVNPTTDTKDVSDDETEWMFHSSQIKKKFVPNEWNSFAYNATFDEGYNVNALAKGILFKKVGGRKGTNPGGVYAGNDGELRYVKFYRDPLQAENEYITNKLYSELSDYGIEVPNTKVFPVGESDSAVATQYSLQKMSYGRIRDEHPELKEEYAKQILKGFVMDVFLANWDVVGLEFDNIVFDKNAVALNERTAPIRIDNGSGLFFRAQGGKKNKAQLSGLNEWEGFTDAQINPSYAQIIKDAGFKDGRDFFNQYKFQLLEQIDLLSANISRAGGLDYYIDKLVPNLFATDKPLLKDILQSRLGNLYRKASEIIDSISQHYKPSQEMTTEAQTKSLKRFTKALAFHLGKRFNQPHIKRRDREEFYKQMQARIAYATFALALQNDSMGVDHILTGPTTNMAMDAKDKHLAMSLIRNYATKLRPILDTVNVDINQFVYDPHNLREMSFPNSTTYFHNRLIDKNEYESAKRRYIFPDFNQDQRMQAQTVAAEQNLSWRKQLDWRTSMEFSAVQTDWQAHSHFTRKKKNRQARNKFINDVIGNVQNPPTFVWNKPIYRGLSFYMPPNRPNIKSRLDFKYLMKYFSDNRSHITLPPSGFSMDSNQSRKFSDGDQPEVINIVLQLSPNQHSGKLHGLQLAYAYSATKEAHQQAKQTYEEYYAKLEHQKQMWKKKHPAPTPTQPKYFYDTEQWEQAYRNAFEKKQNKLDNFAVKMNQFQYMDSFNHELEIMRPGNAKMLLNKTEKHFFVNGYGEIIPTIVFHLSDDGLTDDPNLIRESYQPTIDTLDQLFNFSITSVHSKESDNLTESFLTEEEGAAAKEAHMKGLHYIGFGRWADDGGYYVAKTENDRLVMVPPEERDKEKGPPSDNFGLSDKGTQMYNQAKNQHLIAKKLQQMADTPPSSPIADKSKKKPIEPIFPLPPNYDKELEKKADFNAIQAKVTDIVEKEYGTNARYYMYTPWQMHVESIAGKPSDLQIANDYNGGRWINAAGSPFSVEICGTVRGPTIKNAIFKNFITTNLRMMGYATMAPTQMFPISEGRLGIIEPFIKLDDNKSLKQYIGDTTMSEEKRKTVVKSFIKAIPAMFIFGMGTQLREFSMVMNHTYAPLGDFVVPQMLMKKNLLMNVYQTSPKEKKHQTNYWIKQMEEMWEDIANPETLSKPPSLNPLSSILTMNSQSWSELIKWAYNNSVEDFKNDMIGNISQVLQNYQDNKKQYVLDPNLYLSEPTYDYIEAGLTFLRNKSNQYQGELQQINVAPPKTLNARVHERAMITLGKRLSKRLSKDLQNKEIDKFIALSIYKMALEYQQENKTGDYEEGGAADIDTTNQLRLRIPSFFTHSFLRPVQEYAKQLVPLLEKGLKIDPIRFAYDPEKILKTTQIATETPVLHNWWENKEEYEKANSTIFHGTMQDPISKGHYLSKQTHEAEYQHATWRDKLPATTYFRLLDVQARWQDSAQYRVERDKRRRRNQFLNSVIGNPQAPAVFATEHFISRGMNLRNRDVTKFFANFQKQICPLPPSGFSMDPSIAEDNCASSRGYGVYMRVHPNDKGQIHGMRLEAIGRTIDNNSHVIKYQRAVDKLEAKIDDLRDRMYEPGVSNSQSQAMRQEQQQVYNKMIRLRKKLDAIGRFDYSSFDYEHEVIRPGNAPVEITGVEKHIFFGRDGEISCLYVIDGKDIGLTTDKSYIREEMEEQLDFDVLDSYFNTSTKDNTINSTQVNDYDKYDYNLN